MNSLIDLIPSTQTPATVRRTKSVDWGLLLGALASIKRSIPDIALRRRAALDLLAGTLSADYAAWVRIDADACVRIEAEIASAQPVAEESRAVAAAEAKKSNEAGKPSHTAWRQTKLVVASQVVEFDGSQSLVVIVPAALHGSMVGAVLQLSVLTLFAGEQDARPTKSDENASTLAAGLELVVRLADARDIKVAVKMICDLVERQLGLEHVAVGLARHSATRVEAIAVSACEALHAKSPQAQLLAECLTESLPHTPLVTWSADAVANPVGIGSWRRLAEAWQVESLTAVRFTDRSGTAVAVCLIGSKSPPDANAESFLLLLGHIAGPMVRVLERAAQGHRIHNVIESLPAWLKGRRLCLLIVAVMLPLLYPWCARTTCPVVLEPISHRLVAAPFEGVFDRSLVKPGDRVDAGQVLGRMDGRELRTRLAACEADLSRAAKSRDVNLAAGKLGGTQIDRLEMERLEHERDVLRRRLEQLEIRSPIAGVVVTGDLLRYEAATLDIGQALYEIAPLDRFTAELAVPEVDLEAVSQEAELTLRLDAVSGATFQGTVERIRPRGELRDNLQVFVAETTIADPDRNLRPGMKGSATVIGPRAPGAWLLLRKPWYATLRFLGL